MVTPRGGGGGGVGTFTRRGSTLSGSNRLTSLSLDGGNFFHGGVGALTSWAFGCRFLAEPDEGWKHRPKPDQL